MVAETTPKRLPHLQVYGHKRVKGQKGDYVRSFLKIFTKFLHNLSEIVQNYSKSYRIERYNKQYKSYKEQGCCYNMGIYHWNILLACYNKDI